MDAGPAAGRGDSRTLVLRPDRPLGGDGADHDRGHAAAPRPARGLPRDRPSGAIVAAGVLLTDPGHGGAGAGYMTVPDGGRRVHEIAAALRPSRRGARPSPSTSFRFRRGCRSATGSWHAVEGQRAAADQTTYVLLEALDADYLIQAGVNASGFLSYLFLSPEYAAAQRGSDALSKAIHPGPGQLVARIPQPRVGPVRGRRLRLPPGPRHDRVSPPAGWTGSSSSASRPAEPGPRLTPRRRTRRSSRPSSSSAGPPARRPAAAPRTTCSRSRSR